MMMVIVFMTPFPHWSFSQYMIGDAFSGVPRAFITASIAGA